MLIPEANKYIVELYSSSHQTSKKKYKKSNKLIDTWLIMMKARELTLYIMTLAD